MWKNCPLLDYQSRELGSAGEDPVLSPGNKENRHAECTRARGCCMMLDKPRQSLTYNARGLGYRSVGVEPCKCLTWIITWR